MNQLITVNEAADRFRCSPKTVYKWIYSGLIPEHTVVRLGRLVRLRRADVEMMADQGITNVRR